jgi:hypothetical protein
MGAGAGIGKTSVWRVACEAATEVRARVLVSDLVIPPFDGVSIT